MTNLLTILGRQLDRRRSDRSRRLLVVEDDTDLGLAVGRVMESVDTRLAVDVASTADQARRLLVREHYEFVLLDYFLDAEELGIDLVALVRATQPRAGMAMMSSLVLADFIEVTARESDLQILPKPFSHEQLAAFMFDVLGTRPQSTRVTAERHELH